MAGLTLALHHGNQRNCFGTFTDLGLLSAEERVLWEKLRAKG